MKGAYDDIIDLPHHVSATRPRMPVSDRAAQFSPFAALTGYEAAVKETARLTDRRIELDEDAKAELDQKLRLFAEQGETRSEVSITYFQPDRKKAGGSYQTVTGIIKRLDDFQRVVIMTQGAQIPLDDIYNIESDVLQSLL